MKSTKRHAFATIRLHSRRSVSMIWSANLVDGRPLIAPPGAYDPQGIDVFPQDDSFADTRRCGVLIPIRRMNHTALETRGRVADALRGLAAALTDSFALRRPKDAPQVESFDGAEAGAVTDAAALLRDDELHRESDRDASARHAKHQALA